MNAYIAKNIHDDVRMASRSGGAFTALSNVILKRKGIIYGCELNRDHVAVHTRTECSTGRDRFRGSKYVQSNMNGCMIEVHKDLENGRYVLFTGTPCQVAGLFAYLDMKNVDTQRLYTCTILCHFVTSPLLLKEYFSRKEKRHRGIIQSIDFRNKKKFGWDDHRETVTIGNREYDSTEYTILFYSGVAVRESCFHCPYKKEELPGNIVLADAWGIQRAAPDFNDNKGVSLVLVNDAKGQELFDEAQEELEFRVVDFADYNKQKTFHEPYPRPAIKDMFWQEYYSTSYAVAYDRYLKVSIGKRITRKLKKVFFGK